MNLTWDSTWRYALGSTAAVALLAFPFIGGRPVPLLTNVDLGFHELGHLVATPLPTGAYFLAGSLCQVAVPAGLAAYFWLRRRDRLAAGLMLAWAATSAHGVSVYIADAPYQQLPLIGGQHDWAFLLGSRGWSAMGMAQPLARFVWFLGLTSGIAGLAACVWPPVEAWIATRRHRSWAYHLSTLPVREVRHLPSDEKYRDGSPG